MIRNLPFASLRVFESVVRLRGFGRAAEQLNVTQSSVSQHVKALEEWTSCRLMIRGKDGSTPTREGQQLADAIAQGFGHVAEACDDLKSRNRANVPIVVSCLPGFAVDWLFPRLFRFDQLHPGIPISISTDADPVDFRSGNADVAIRYGPGGYRNLHVEKLFGEHITPVCSPTLLASAAPLDDVDDLRHHTLLLDELVDIDGNAPTWQYWAEQSGITMPQTKRTRKFGQANMVVQAAIEGYGVALGRGPLVSDAVRSGKLVAPFDHVVESAYAYWFVCPPTAIRQPNIQAFRNWLLDEAAQQVASGNKFT